ncbi:MAG: M48 family metallopeptidase [Polaromonas sp.]|nr:M48 family metallopeptidase [Polaromonas sp.]
MTRRAACLCCQRRPLLQGMALLLLSPGPVLSQGGDNEGVEVGGNSVFSRLVPAETVEQSAAKQYAEMLQQAAAKDALGGKNHPQVRRLRAIAQRIIPHAMGWNPRARNWRWEVNLIGSRQVNAFCMPGGKIAFYSGILDQLQLTEDEVATVMGHEIAHALREHARARMGKNAATGIGANLLSNVLGLGQLGQTVTSYGAQLLTLQFSRSDESDADLVGMELAARAGFDPRAGVSLWQKMAAASKGAPPQWLSTHPSGNTRIADIQANLPKVLPLYARSQNK